MQYKDFKIEDFLLDNLFIEWAKENKNDVFWQSFFLEFPKQKIIAEQAKNMILEGNNVFNAIEKEALRNRIFEEIEEEKIILSKERGRSISVYWWASVAASILIIMSLYFFKFGSINKPENIYTELIQKQPNQLIEITNDNIKPKLIILPDKSSILLQKDGRLSYAQNFEKLPTREIYLSGEAFFEVTKNAEKPFIVYANELVTKVLGTSFNVKAFSDDVNVIITVKTGKVAVYSNTKSNQKEVNSNLHAEGIVLKPNQQIVFDRNQAQVLKSLVKTPSIQELPDFQKVSFDFEDTPISKVFDLLEKNYGVEIIYDEELLKSCKLTARMSDEHLFEKLRLICIAIDCEYQTVDGQIVIHSKGCK